MMYVKLLALHLAVNVQPVGLDYYYDCGHRNEKSGRVR